MKKHLLTIFSVIFYHCAVAQVCIPDAVTDPRPGYVLPDSATGFTHACAGNAYEQIIYIKAPEDTTFTYNGTSVTATVDSFVVSAVMGGLPVYLTVASNPTLLPAAPGDPKTDFPRLLIPGGNMACVTISGNVPSGTAAGSQDLVIGVRAYLNALGGILRIDTAVDIDHYKFVIDAPGTGVCASTSITPTNKKALSGLQAVPNPAKDQVNVIFDAHEDQSGEIIVYNLLGHKVATVKVAVKAGANSVPLKVGELAAGVYLYTLRTKEGSVSARMFISK